MSEEARREPEETVEFDEAWYHYTEENLGHPANLNIPEEFNPSEWEELGYIPPERRSGNERYNWSQFYDFWLWLKENGYID